MASDKVSPRRAIRQHCLDCCLGSAYEVQKCQMHDCGGEFFPTGVAFTTDPPIYQYKCNKCGKLAEFQFGVFREVDG